MSLEDIAETTPKLKQFCNGEKCGLEPLQNSGWSIRISKSKRLMLTPQTMNGEPIWIAGPYYPVHYTDRDIKNYVPPELPATLEEKPVYQFNDTWIQPTPEQERIFDQSYPMLITGVPGSGKTCSAFELACQFYQKNGESSTILYIAANSHQAETIRTEWKKTDYPQETLSVKTIEELVSTPSGKADITPKVFKQWLNNKCSTLRKNHKNKHATIATIEKLDWNILRLELALCHTLGADAYHKLPDSHSCLDATCRKELSTLFYNSYMEFLKNNCFDYHLAKPTLPKADLIILDEAQNAGPLLIQACRTANSRFVACMDEQQSLLVPWTSVFLGCDFYKNGQTFTKVSLTQGWRCPLQVTNLANEILLSQRQKYPEQKAPYAAIEAAQPIEGEVSLITELSEETTRQLKVWCESTDTLVVADTQRYSREKLKEIYGPCVILDLKHILSLEFNNVVLHEPLSFLRGKQESTLQDFRRLFVSITRARKRLIIVDSSHQGQNENLYTVIAEAAKTTEVPSTDNVQLTTDADWLRMAETLRQQRGLDETVDTILQDRLGYTPEQIRAFWQPSQPANHQPQAKKSAKPGNSLEALTEKIQDELRKCSTHFFKTKYLEVDPQGQTLMGRLLANPQNKKPWQKLCEDKSTKVIHMLGTALDEPCSTAEGEETPFSLGRSLAHYPHCNFILLELLKLFKKPVSHMLVSPLPTKNPSEDLPKEYPLQWLKEPQLFLPLMPPADQILGLDAIKSKQQEGWLLKKPWADWTSEALKSFQTDPEVLSVLLDILTVVACDTQLNQHYWPLYRWFQAQDDLADDCRYSVTIVNAFTRAAALILADADKLTQEMAELRVIPSKEMLQNQELHNHLETAAIDVIARAQLSAWKALFPLILPNEGNNESDWSILNYLAYRSSNTDFIREAVLSMVPHRDLDWSFFWEIPTLNGKKHAPLAYYLLSTDLAKSLPDSCWQAFEDKADKDKAFALDILLTPHLTHGDQLDCVMAKISDEALGILIEKLPQNFYEKISTEHLIGPDVPAPEKIPASLIGHLSQMPSGRLFLWRLNTVQPNLVKQLLMIVEMNASLLQQLSILEPDFIYFIHTVFSPRPTKPRVSCGAIRNWLASMRLRLIKPEDVSRELMEQDCFRAGNPVISSEELPPLITRDKTRVNLWKTMLDNNSLFNANLLFLQMALVHYGGKGLTHFDLCIILGHMIASLGLSAEKLTTKVRIIEVKERDTITSYLILNANIGLPPSSRDYYDPRLCCQIVELHQLAVIESQELFLGTAPNIHLFMPLIKAWSNPEIKVRACWDPFGGIIPLTTFYNQTEETKIALAEKAYAGQLIEVWKDMLRTLWGFKPTSLQEQEQTSQPEPQPSIATNSFSQFFSSGLSTLTKKVFGDALTKVADADSSANEKGVSNTSSH